MPRRYKLGPEGEILGYSRMRYIEFVTDMELLTKCLKYRDKGDFRQEKRRLSASH